MNRIEQKMLSIKQNNEKAFITFITAGLPDLEVLTPRNPANDATRSI